MLRTVGTMWAKTVIRWWQTKLHVPVRDMNNRRRLEGYINKNANAKVRNWNRNKLFDSTAWLMGRQNSSLLALKVCAIESQSWKFGETARWKRLRFQSLIFIFSRIHFSGRNHELMQQTSADSWFKFEGFTTPSTAPLVYNRIAWEFIWILEEEDARQARAQKERQEEERREVTKFV